MVYRFKKWQLCIYKGSYQQDSLGLWKWSWRNQSAARLRGTRSAKYRRRRCVRRRQERRIWSHERDGLHQRMASSTLPSLIPFSTAWRGELGLMLACNIARNVFGSSSLSISSTSLLNNFPHKENDKQAVSEFASYIYISSSLGYWIKSLFEPTK